MYTFCAKSPVGAIKKLIEGLIDLISGYFEAVIELWKNLLTGPYQFFQFVLGSLHSLFVSIGNVFSFFGEVRSFAFESVVFLPSFLVVFFSISISLLIVKVVMDML